MKASKKSHIFRRNWIFRHTFCINNPHWQSGGIIIFLYKYFIVISDILVGTFLDVLFLLLAVIIQGHLTSQEGTKIELQKKVHRRICVSDITFSNAHPPFYVTFYCFLRLLPLPFQVQYLLNGPYKNSQYCYGRYSVWWYHEWRIKNMKISKISCNLTLAGWHL